ELNVIGPIQDGTHIPFLGIAHGWAGMLYATLLWCHSARRALPDAVEERLRQLTACGEPIGRGIRWQVKLRRHTRGLQNNYMSGWCNGSAGYVFLWTLAYRTFHDEAYLTLAEKAAWNAWEEAIASDSLCCGLSGGAYGLMNLYRHTGDRRWLYHA